MTHGNPCLENFVGDLSCEKVIEWWFKVDVILRDGGTTIHDVLSFVWLFLVYLDGWMLDLLEKLQGDLGYMESFNSIKWYQSHSLLWSPQMSTWWFDVTLLKFKVCITSKRVSIFIWNFNG